MVHRRANCGARVGHRTCQCWLRNWCSLAHSALRALGRTDLRVLVLEQVAEARLKPTCRRIPAGFPRALIPRATCSPSHMRKPSELGVAHRHSGHDSRGFAGRCRIRRGGMPVLHFLTDDDQCALLRGIAGHLPPGVLLLAATGAQVQIEPVPVRRIRRRSSLNSPPRRRSRLIGPGGV